VRISEKHQTYQTTTKSVDGLAESLFGLTWPAFPIKFGPTTQGTPKVTMYLAKLGWISESYVGPGAWRRSIMLWDQYSGQCATVRSRAGLLELPAMTPVTSSG